MAEVRLPSPVRATRLEHIDDIETVPGAFEYYTRQKTGPGVERGIIFNCPCGCGKLAALAFEPRDPDDAHAWTWDGNREAPTLTPSVVSHDDGTDSPTHWHGWLQAGMWNQA